MYHREKCGVEKRRLKEEGRFGLVVAIDQCQWRGGRRQVARLVQNSFRLRRHSCRTICAACLTLVSVGVHARLYLSMCLLYMCVCVCMRVGKRVCVCICGWRSLWLCATAINPPLLHSTLPPPWLSFSLQLPSGAEIATQQKQLFCSTHPPPSTPLGPTSPTSLVLCFLVEQHGKRETIVYTMASAHGSRPLYAVEEESSRALAQATLFFSSFALHRAIDYIGQTSSLDVCLACQTDTRSSSSAT